MKGIVAKAPDESWLYCPHCKQATPDTRHPRWKSNTTREEALRIMEESFGATIDGGKG